ncbi:helix-turn-helix domain-containing protein [Brachybacterium alimentarium]|uniref:helix-turn-helix domain-containing protein n=1 Tax=Brachybacterium alimentarium TaxID=47845 RepID=UPI003FD276EC
MTDTEGPVDLEERLATKIRELRERDGLTYRQLAERMTTVGCEVSGPTIQKTEKAGRRVPVDELVGYSRAFDMSLGELLGIPDESQLTRVWQTYIGLERLANVLRHAHTEYRGALDEVRENARQNRDLVDAIRDRRDKYLDTFRRKAEQQAANDDEDVSTPEKLEEFMSRWGYLDVPALAAAKDVLEGVDHGEGQ